MDSKVLPKKGLAGLKEHWRTDSVSGFLVFLLALPLSLGIAKASGFDPAMGVLTAIVGGMFVSFFRVSPMIIYGPAAALITVCAAAIADMDALGYKGHDPVHMTCGIIIVMALIQIIVGFLKLGSLSNFFPHSAIHGMLAAVGIIIIAKQIPVLLGDDPGIYKGETSIELLMDIPRFVKSSNTHLAAVGLISLIIMFAMPIVKLNFLKKVPAPIVVLFISVPLGIYWHFKHDYSLVKIGNFGENVGLNADFRAIGTLTFWKYVLMFLFVSSLESHLTVKAMDGLDPYKRESNYNGNLIGLGAGNALSSLLGGLPLVSEVVRSGSNITFGAKTKWSNFFHGFFLLGAMLLMIPVLEYIPNAALAAILIYVGFRLAAPKEFINTYQIGREQLAIFLVTVLVALAEDLILGVAAGIFVKLIFHLYNGASFKRLFFADYEISKSASTTYITVKGVAVFSNLIGYKKVLMGLKPKGLVVMDFTETILIDHSFMEFIHQFKNQYNENGGTFKTMGYESHKALSNHPLATRKLVKR